jgi:hypothetical protein
MQLYVYNRTLTVILMLSHACLEINSLLAKEAEIYSAGACPDITGSFSTTNRHLHSKIK